MNAMSAGRDGGGQLVGAGLRLRVIVSAAVSKHFAGMSDKTLECIHLV